MSDVSCQSPSRREIYTVSRLNREARALLEGSFPLLWVEGEISNLSRPRSGHIYFTLKDEFAQVRCAMFRMKASKLGVQLKDGSQIQARIRISLYENRGDFQLIVEHMEEAGDGALRRAFETLQQRLDEQGLFDDAHKRPLPSLPQCIGVVTSPSGAAIRDILTVLQRRFAAIPVVIYPVAVQGVGAALEIAAAIALAGERAECDVLIVGRGGGSLEDLWAFNEEAVARAIYDCPIPVVSAVGHEVDVSISDLVADVRAPTPSAAAELLSPDAEQWQIRLSALRQRLHQTLQRSLQRQQRELQQLQRRLRHPGQRLQQIAQRLDELESRFSKGLNHHLQQKKSHLTTLQARVAQHSPQLRLQTLHARQQELTGRLQHTMTTRLQRDKTRLAIQLRALETISPLATLQRGYAIVTQVADGKLVERAADAVVGTRVQVQLAEGELVCRVEESINAND